MRRLYYCYNGNGKLPPTKLNKIRNMTQMEFDSLIQNTLFMIEFRIASASGNGDLKLR
jgi:hypothetical protein